MIPRKLGDAPTGIIQKTYALADYEPDPHRTLSNLSRSVTILGHLLECLADRYATFGKRYARVLAVIGSLFWGIVEFSVPSTVQMYLFRNWLKMGAFLGILIVLLAWLTSTGKLWGIGFTLLAFVIVVALLSSTFCRYMKRGSFPVKFAKWAGLLLVLAFVIAGTINLSISYGNQIAAGLHKLEQPFRWAADLHIKSEEQKQGSAR